MEEYLLVYDADCGPCTRFKRAVDWFDKYNRLSYSSLIEADERGLLNSLPKTRRHKSFHLISPRGEISSGAEAIPNLLELLPLGTVTFSLRLFPPGRYLINFLYTTLSRLHDSGSCGYKGDTNLSQDSKLKLAKEKREGIGILGNPLI